MTDYFNFISYKEIYTHSFKKIDKNLKSYVCDKIIPAASIKKHYKSNALNKDIKEHNYVSMKHDISDVINYSNIDHNNFPYNPKFIIKKNVSENSEFIKTESYTNKSINLEDIKNIISNESQIVIKNFSKENINSKLKSLCEIFPIECRETIDDYEAKYSHHLFTKFICLKKFRNINYKYYEQRLNNLLDFKNLLTFILENSLLNKI